ncbi:hypothetical protein ACS0TY_028830 [Phlomoides rotata]
MIIVKNSSYIISMAGKDDKTLQIAMFPWIAFGHILPYFELSKLIAQKGHKISFISTPRNIDRLPKLPPNLSSSINLVKIPLPKVADLPENAEATVDIHGGLTDHLKKAFDSMQSGLTRFLEDSRPDWLICDFASHWLPPIAAELRIPTAFFMIYGAHFMGFFGSTDDSDYRTKVEEFMVPPKWVKFDTEVAFRRFEANQMVKWHENGSGFSDRDRYRKVITGCEVILIRDVYEFEAEWLAVVEELHKRAVVPVGLLPPTVQDSDSDKDDETWVSIRSWLDGQDQRSVVYVAFGSEVRPSHDQLTELAHGLDLSGVPFLFNLRGSESDELPAGFEERLGSRGMVWRSWAPQMKILSHDSVGGFLSHCGWSSVIEAMMFGIPLIELPFIEQALTARVVSQKQIGVEIPRDEEDGSFTRNSVANSVKLVMLQGKKYREKAKELSPLFRDRELQSGYVDNLVDFLKKSSRC